MYKVRGEAETLYGASEMPLALPATPFEPAETRASRLKRRARRLYAAG
jgi:hypothetical protein